MSKAKQVTVTNRLRNELIFQAPTEEVDNSTVENRQFKQKKIEFTRKERDGEMMQHESTEIVLFGRPKHDFQGYPVTLKKKDWDKLRDANPAIDGLIDEGKLVVR